MSKILILFEIFRMIKQRKKWILLPIILFLGIFGLIIVLTEGSAIAPFIYTIF